MHQLEQLLDLHGISSSYWNYKGSYVDVPMDNRIGLLNAIYANNNINFNNSEQAEAILDKHLLELWCKPLDPLCITNHNNCFIDINIPLDELNQNQKIDIENSLGHTVFSINASADALLQVGERTVRGRSFVRKRLSFESLAMGYYKVKYNQKEFSSLAVCPEACYVPEWLSQNQKQSGVIVQLYSLKTNKNFGVGDFNDLTLLIDSLAPLGFTSVGLNPLHALLPNLHESYSPYSPSDRRFINILYIALPQSPEYEYVLNTLPQDIKDDITVQIDALRLNPFIDYAKVKHVKFFLLEKMCAYFLGHDLTSARHEKFNAFFLARSEQLKSYVLLDALSDVYGPNAAAQMLKDALICEDTFEVLYQKHKATCDVYIYAQWLAYEQFKAVQLHALKKGMSIGLVNDLAVGADRMGTEVITNPALFCQNAAVGAPPDEIAPVGQNWGLPPIDPLEQSLSGYKHLIDLFKNNMSNCGALRIDHVMGLTRLWWCPPGAHADHGAYVYYPFDKTLSLLKLESHLNQCAVIGEDLGIVPENFREALRAANVLSNKVMYFEREDYATFKHPFHYDQFALAMINNHDVPTLASWWNGEDIELRDELDAIEVGKTAEELKKVRADEKSNLVSHLVYGDTLPKHWRGKSLEEPADQPLIFAIIEWASQAQSVLFVLQLEDLILMTKPVNVPGTFKEYPNWKRKLTHSLEDIFSNKDINKLLTKISQKRRSS